MDLRAANPGRRPAAPYSETVSDPSAAEGVRQRNLARLLPNRRDYADLPRSWRRDVLAGITVGVVALPLAWPTLLRVATTWASATASNPKAGLAPASENEET